MAFEQEKPGSHSLANISELLNGNLFRSIAESVQIIGILVEVHGVGICDHMLQHMRNLYLPGF